jgi:hypothetical protein
MSRSYRSNHTHNLRVRLFIPFPPFPFIVINDHNASRAVAILFQAILFTLTIYKFILAVRDGWGDVPLIALLTRDATWAFCLLLCMSSFLTRPSGAKFIVYSGSYSSVGYAGHLVLYALHDPAYAGILFG